MTLESIEGIVYVIMAALVFYGFFIKKK